MVLAELLSGIARAVLSIYAAFVERVSYLKINNISNQINLDKAHS